MRDFADLAVDNAVENTTTCTSASQGTALAGAMGSCDTRSPKIERSAPAGSARRKRSGAGITRNCRSRSTPRLVDLG